MPEPQKAKTIAIDFDGVIAHYNGFVSADDIQEPNEKLVEAIHLLKAKGFKILIHSTRGDAFLKSYCEQFTIPYDYINKRPDKHGENEGKPITFVYVDDRAICYKGQSPEELVKEIENFKAYWEK